jgi:hypothetical protein
VATVVVVVVAVVVAAVVVWNKARFKMLAKLATTRRCALHTGGTCSLLRATRPACLLCQTPAMAATAAVAAAAGARKLVKVDIVSDVACPWYALSRASAWACMTTTATARCYVGQRAFEIAAMEYTDRVEFAGALPDCPRGQR